MNPFTSAIARGIVEGGDLKDNITRLVKVFADRLRVMDAALQKHVPQAQFVTPSGGYFFWLRLPGIDTVQVRAHAAAHKVDFRPGKLFSSQDGLGDYLRVGFSYYDVENLEEGVRRLAKCVGDSL